MLGGERKAKAAYEIAQKKRKIKAAQTRVKEIRTGASAPMTWGTKADYESYLAETIGGPVVRDLAGKVVGPTRGRRKK